MKLSRKGIGHEAQLSWGTERRMDKGQTRKKHNGTAAITDTQTMKTATKEPPLNGQQKKAGVGDEAATSFTCSEPVKFLSSRSTHTFSWASIILQVVYQYLCT